ncbi:MAG: hypothetical protein ACYDCQ_04750 [Dehalococcoidia bacterium]
MPRDSGAPHLPAPPARPAGFWQRHAVEFPEPLSPFAAAWVLPIHNAALRSALTDLGLLIDRIEYREIDGYVYRRMAPFGRDRMPPALLQPLYRALVRVRPASRKRLVVAMSAMQSGAFRAATARWHAEDRTRLLAEQDVLEPGFVPDGDDAALDRYAEQALRHGQEAIRIRCRVLVSAAIMMGLDAPGPGLSSNGSIETGSLRGQLAVHDPIVSTPVSSPSESDEETPTPEAAGSASAAATALAQSTALAFRSSAAANVAAKLGRRLAERELIADPRDVCFLSLDEARAALRSGGDGLAAAIADRRERWQRARESQPAAAVGARPQELPLALYPDAVAAMTRALQRTLAALWGDETPAKP